MKKNFFYLGAFLSFTTFGQQGIVASGGEASGNGMVSYSIGQLDFTSHNATNGSIHEGVQQPYEFFTISVKEVFTDINISLYPNPATDLVTISMGEWEKMLKPSYNLTDEQGRIIRTGKLESNETIVKLTDLESAGYYLNIMEDQQLIKSFKLVKTPN